LLWWPKPNTKEKINAYVQKPKAALCRILKAHR